MLPHGSAAVPQMTDALRNLAAMDPNLYEWLHLAVRWFHFMMGVAWVGASFYFTWLNYALRPPAPPVPGVEGEVWAVHGGGYYHIAKHHPTMEKVPSPLHWFKWEAYLTWLSGITLLGLVYWGQASMNMVRSGGPGPAATIGIGIGTLIAGWFVYDGLCRSPLAKQPMALAGVGVALLTATAAGLSQVLSGRAAFMHVGAMIGTIMAGNVFFVIIPGQKAMVDATLAGRPADPAYGKAAGLRSLHNNYLTLPVLFVMISNHFPMTFGHAYNWAVLAAISAIGMMVRHFMNRHDQERPIWWLGPAAALGLIGLAFVTKPAEVKLGPSDPSAAMMVISQRCTPCHSELPSQPGFKAPPKGVLLQTPAQIEAQRANIKRVAVDTEFMPLGNLTHITPEERAILAAWAQ